MPKIKNLSINKNSIENKSNESLAEEAAVNGKNDKWDVKNKK